MGGLSYRDAGVDIDAKHRAFDLMKGHVRSTFGPQVLSDFGTFGPMFALGEHRAPVLVASADGVGTKLKLGFALDKHDTVGIDIVNHCVDDILTTGAAPLFFLDYVATGKLEPATVAEVVKGLAAGCRENGCALLGGETAEMPSFYQPGEYDLAGFIVGLVERDRVIDGSRIAAGDVLLALPSSGLHTNGYSLVRRVFGLADRSSSEVRRALAVRYPDLGRTLGEELMEPHRSYLGPLRPHLARIKGLAHITGGGLLDNVPRVLPASFAARFDSKGWTRPPIFDLVQRLGGIPDAEMQRTFNLGLGMVIVVRPEDAGAMKAALPGCLEVGEIVPRAGPAVVVA
jgi:phosphoribosylformylglycinamidine cyclo-ligase